jgi:hypothetical protein
MDRGEYIRVTVVVGSDGSDNSVVKLFNQLLTSIHRSVTDDLGKTLLVKVGPRLLGVLRFSKHLSSFQKSSQHYRKLRDKPCWPHMWPKTKVPGWTISQLLTGYKGKLTRRAIRRERRIGSS